ncbi:unnamed protein product [Rotaria socialis]|uniref:Uncharacterized protein n=1 Tax=Rotaria socialis TaxID=392032 RepID=A0A818GBP5_9BILA|nr:unnamed protein product [Rotaria socialis]CAF3487335.1 unnamed protein product [Rotaria socialis]CAF4335931.1 unnamed protein product [Rotaria socialis]CAF4341801.1 unnamed protein product [Rotaria socialis]CAF4514315.1 unnamed protein product [Rotaria socialis]
MAMANAEKQKGYRENLKARGLHQVMKQKNAARMRKLRQNLTGNMKEAYDKKHAQSQKAYRNKEKESKIFFSSRQSFGKAVKKVKRVLPKDLNKKKIVSQALAQSVGILPKDSHQRVSRKLSTKIKDTVVLFYCRDDISYQMPGQRDTIVVKNNYSRTTYQKRILLYTIREAYEIFLVENPGISIARTIFAEMRPEHVVIKSCMAHRKHVHGSICSDLHSFTSALVCDESNYNCMASSCLLCENKFDTNIKNNIIDRNITVKWYQWKNINRYAAKEEEQGSVEQCVELLASKVRPFLLHVYIKRQQNKSFEESKSNSNSNKIVVQVDYSENFDIKDQDQIQAAHWNTKSVSLFTAHAWCGENNYSFSLISNNLTHDKYCISNCIIYIINKLKQHLASLGEIFFLVMVQQANSSNVIC